jgi:hypothetical protein
LVSNQFPLLGARLKFSLDKSVEFIHQIDKFGIITARSDSLLLLPILGKELLKLFFENLLLCVDRLAKNAVDLSSWLRDSFVWWGASSRGKGEIWH